MAKPDLQPDSEEFHSHKAIEDKSTLNKKDFKSFVSDIHEYLVNNFDLVPKSRQRVWKKDEWKEFATAYIEENHELFSKTRDGFSSSDHFSYPDDQHELAFLAFSIMRIEVPKIVKKRKKEDDEDEEASVAPSSVKKQKGSQTATPSKPSANKSNKAPSGAESESLSEQDIEEPSTPAPAKGKSSKPSTPASRKITKVVKSVNVENKVAAANASNDEPVTPISRKPRPIDSNNQSQTDSPKRIDSEKIMRALKLLSAAEMATLYAQFPPAAIKLFEDAADAGDAVCKHILSAKRGEIIDSDEDLSESGNRVEPHVWRLVRAISDLVPGVGVARNPDPKSKSSIANHVEPLSNPNPANNALAVRNPASDHNASTSNAIQEPVILTLQVSFASINGSTPFMINIPSKAHFAMFIGKLLLKGDHSIATALKAANKIVFTLNKFGEKPAVADIPAEKVKTIDAGVNTEVTHKATCETVDTSNDADKLDNQVLAPSLMPNNEDMTVDTSSAENKDSDLAIVQVPKPAEAAPAASQAETSPGPVKPTVASITGKRILDITEKEEDREIMWERIVAAVVATVRDQEDKIVEAEFEV